MKFYRSLLVVSYVLQHSPHETHVTFRQLVDFSGSSTVGNIWDTTRSHSWTF